MIRSFGYREAEQLWNRQPAPSVDPRIHRVALRKLRQIGAAVILDDLRVPPGNRIEALQGDRSGQYSIRINDQWQVCFVWKDGGAENVAVVDYH